MRFHASALIAAFLMLLLCTPEHSGAQIYVPTQVEVSKEKINISGKIFFMHTVLKGQTLFSISKAYGVSQEDIILNNPTLADGLKTGSIIYIPSNEPKRVIVHEDDEEEEEEDAATDKTASAGAAAAGTAAAAATTAAGTAAASAGAVAAASSASTASAAPTPAPKPSDIPTEPITGNVKFQTYTVKWYETLYDVAKKFNVSVNDLAELNGMKPNSVLEKRQKLRIPDANYSARNTARSAAAENTYSAAAAAAATTTAAMEAVMMASETSAAVPTPATDQSPAVQQTPASIYQKDNPSNVISLVLPFGAAQSAGKADVNYIDFCGGAMMAMNDMREKDAAYSKYTLKVVDLKSYPSSDKMLSSGILNGSDLIIGPVQEKEMVKVAAWGKENRTLTVSPLDVKTAGLADENPYFILFPATSDVLLAHTAECLINHGESTVSILYEKGTEKLPAVTDVRQTLSSKGVLFKEFSYGVLEGRSITGKMREALIDPTRGNIIYIASENEAFVSEALRNLHLLKNANSELNISVVGLSKWRNFESVELEYLHNLNTSICLGYYVDYDKPASLSFTRRYESAFHTTPTPFAYQGYDIITYFLTVIEQNGLTFPERFGEDTQPLVQSNVLFKQANSESGFKNASARVITYRPGWIIECR